MILPVLVVVPTFCVDGLADVFVFDWPVGAEEQPAKTKMETPSSNSFVFIKLLSVIPAKTGIHAWIILSAFQLSYY